MSKQKGKLLGALVIAIVKTDDGIETRLTVQGGIEVDEAKALWGGKAYAVAFNPDAASGYQAPTKEWVANAKDLLDGEVEEVVCNKKSCSPKRGG